MAATYSTTLEYTEPQVEQSGLNTNKAVDFSGAPTVALPAATTIGGSAVVALGDITSSSTSATAFTVTNTGVFVGTDVVEFTANSATSGRVFAITANGLTSGAAMLITSSGTLTTTANLLTLTANSATTAAGLLRVNANGLTSGIGAVITSSATAITGAGRLLRVDHTGATGTSAILSEFASAANDETVIFKVTASSALALGTAAQVSIASVTTGTGLAISNADALTTGTIANFTSNSADVTARNLVKIINDNTAAVGAVPLYLQQDAVGTTHFKTLMLLGTIGIYVSDETSPNTALTAAKGSICLNGSATGQAFWNTDGSTAWTALA